MSQLVRHGANYASPCRLYEVILRNIAGTKFVPVCGLLMTDDCRHAKM